MIGFPSENTFRSIFASKPIFIFDTNIFLNLLRYSKEASIEILKIYTTVSNDIRIPAQVHKEFTKNFPIVSGQRTGEIKTAKTEIKNSINSCSYSIQKQLDLMVKRKFENASTIANQAVTDLLKIKKSIDNYVQIILEDKTVFLSDEDVYSFVENLWVAQSHVEYPLSRLFEIYRDGSFRYQYQIPPGYMDDPQNNKESGKKGIDIFGDLVLWNQIIDYGRREKRSVVFVTSDVKEDWFELNNSKHPVSPRQELIDEFSEQTNGLEICILTSELFVELLGKIQAIDTEIALLEMQIDDFVDITVRNNSSKIVNSLLKWANKEENIFQFPFPEDVDRLLSIENMRIVVKSTSLQMNEKIEYSAMLQGVADFSGINYDAIKKRNVSDQITSSFMFDLRIAFYRNYERTQSGRCIPAKEIDSLTITNVIFEAIPSTDISLESNRGVFILPTDEDKEIYSYMESIWDQYEKCNSVNKAEALVYFDAANHFCCSLLEINRAYTLMQNQKSNINLSINEIDALALKRFSDICIKMDNGVGSFMDKTAPLGEAYPIPDSMKQLPPEEGKELVVTFTVECKHIENKYIKIAGSTNLPSSTLLMISLVSIANSYHAQSKSEVDENGKFASEVFQNSKNLDGNALINGKYTLEIVTPIVSVQQETVKAIIGAKGRNLSGEYVTEDPVFGKTIRLTKELEI